MTDLDPRRFLDGGGEDGTIFSGISDELSSIKDAIAGAFSGVTAADVADGSVDTSQLSRKDQAALAIDGAVPGFFDAVNPWGVGLEFDLSVTAFCAAHGGVVLVVGCNAGVADTLEGAIVSPRFALLWDDQTVAQQGTLNLDFTSQTFLIAQIGSPQGQKLTLWVTDSDISFTLIKQGAPSDADAIRKEVFGAVGAASGSATDSIKSFFAGIVDLPKEAIIASAIIGGIVLYVVLKSELKGGGL